MKTIIYHTCDKSGWPAGPWNDEPDKIQWPDAATGLPCLAVRHPSLGHWCGYVGVPEDHPFFGKSYVGFCSDGKTFPEVHGGFTYFDLCDPGEAEATGICHLPAEGEPDHVWWFGFDCAHSNDYQPGLSAHIRMYIDWGEIYRTLGYVQSNCQKLASFLASASSS